MLTRSQIAPNTFRRLVKQFELLKPDRDSANKHRLAFAKAHANEMWQADTLYGPYVQINGAPVQTRLIAFHGRCLARLLSRPVLPGGKRGHPHRIAPRGVSTNAACPHALYVDNGSIYSSKEIIQICARVGCLLAPHAGARRRGQRKSGKIFPNGARQFLARDLDLSSLEALNRQFTQWVEEQYNAQAHSVLGMSPLDRFALDRKSGAFPAAQ